MIAAKAEARKAARARRKTARLEDSAGAQEAAANARLLDLLGPHHGKMLSGYMPIQSELSPLAAMQGWATHSPVCLPVVEGEGQPLSFRPWAPGCAMQEGAFGAQIPADPQPCRPQILIVPLLAFDANAGRLGYGGGFYDRSLAQLSAHDAIIAIGLAYEAQLSHIPLPREPTDLPLQAVITEARVLQPHP